MNTNLPSFQDFLAAWTTAGRPNYLTADVSESREGRYFGAPIHSSNAARIATEGLPANVTAQIPQSDTERTRAGAIVGPSWTRNHGIVLDVYYSGYSNGWSLIGVATYLPDEDRWVHPTEVHQYSTPDSV